MKHAGAKISGVRALQGVKTWEEAMRWLAWRSPEFLLRLGEVVEKSGLEGSRGRA